MLSGPPPAPRNASRTLYGAAATLAAGVLADSTAEHYRAGFHNRVMFVAPTVSAAVVATAVAARYRGSGRGVLPRAVFTASILTGLVGFGFHVTNVSRRVGGWNSVNLLRGAPMAAPLALTMAGLLGSIASRVGRARALSVEGSTPTRSEARALVGLTSLALLGTATEAGVLHFRGAFQNPFMYAPAILPPVTAAALATTGLADSAGTHVVARTLLRLTYWLGVAGSGFHVWGIHRRMGGWRNWRQNLLAGPPLPAPPAFSGLALAGLAGLELLKRRGTR